ncbi:alpha/beta hydrolase [Tistrella bauzanensis]|uniref:alpha/beta hydrolase n=1 Tax=Tistrella TaxID=171436 RepID=UPI0031F628A6
MTSFDAAVAARAAMETAGVPPAPPGPAPDVTGTVLGPDGIAIRHALWHAAPGRTQTGSVLLLQGRGEFVEKYAEVAGRLTAMGRDVLAIDWRGQGRSGRMLADPTIGHVDDFDRYLDDLDAVMAGPGASLPRPLAVLGHSMGGHLGLRWVVERASAGGAGGPAAVIAPDRLIMTAPMIGIRMVPPMGTMVPALARIMCRRGLSERFAAGQGPDRAGNGRFQGNILTHDPARWARERALIAADPSLHLGGTSWGWLAAAFRSITAARRAVAARGRDIRLPVTIMSAGAERVVDNRAHLWLAGQLPSAEVIIAPGAFHEILMETDHLAEPVWSALAARLSG